MFSLRCLRFQKSAVGTSQRRRAWEERVAGLIAIQEQKAANNTANQYENKYEKGQYTPLPKAFPEMEASNFAAMAKKRAAEDSPPNAKVHVAALVGPANAGKSSLMNALTHRLCSAEGRSSGTTASAVKGYSIVGPSQIIFVDTPGLVIHKGFVRHQKMRDLNPVVWDSLLTANSILACVPVHNNGFLDTDHKTILQQIARRAMVRETPIDLVITMMDRITSPKLKDYYFSMRSEIEGLGIPIRKSFETSTRTSTGLIEIKDYLASIATPKPWEAEERGRDQTQAAMEVIRQALHTHLPIPIPYEASPHIVGWTRKSNGTTEVFVEIFFGRPASMHTFLGKIAPIANDCNRMATREFERSFKFQFQAFLSTSGMKSE